MDATLYRRDRRDWAAQDYERLHETIELPAIGCRLAVAEIYESTGLSEEEPTE